MNVDETIWKQTQEHLGYTNEEMKLFRDNPHNVELVKKAMTNMNKQILCEVVEAKGCMAGHKKGDKIYIDLAGGINTQKSPDKLCMHLIEAGTNYIYTACELVHHGIAPDRMRFKRFGCLDVGLECGGWGKVVSEVTVVDC